MATSAAGLAIALATRLAGRSASRAAPACKASSMRCSRSRAIKSALRAARVSIRALILFSPPAPQCRGVVFELFQGRREGRGRVARDFPEPREDQHGDGDIEQGYSADRLETVVIPEPGNDKQRGEKKREETEHGADRRQQHHLLDALARLGKLDACELEAGAQYRERTGAELRHRAHDAALRPAVLTLGHFDQRRLINTPTRKPTAAAAPIACHGLSRT